MKNTVRHKFAQSALDGAVAEGQAEFTDILLVEPPNFVFACSAHHFKCGQFGFHKRYPLIQVLIRCQNRSEQTLDKGQSIFRSFVPAALGLRRRTVIQIFVFGNLGFKRNILTYEKPFWYKSSMTSKSAYSAISFLLNRY